MAFVIVKAEGNYSFGKRNILVNTDYITAAINQGGSSYRVYLGGSTNPGSIIMTEEEYLKLGLPTFSAK